MAQTSESGNWFQIMTPSNIEMMALNNAHPQPLAGRAWKDIKAPEIPETIR